MATTFRLRTWTRFFAPPEEVWAWKTDFANIQRELAPHRFRVDDPAALTRALSGPLPVTLPARFSLFGALPAFDWPIELTEVVPGVRFRDRSSNKLYRDFVHTHELERTDEGCRYIDDVRFTPALPAQKLAAILTQRTFVARHRVAAGAFPADPQATAVSVLRVEEPGA